MPIGGWACSGRQKRCQEGPVDFLSNENAWARDHGFYEACGLGVAEADEIVAT
jgi:hypothetical protein